MVSEAFLSAIISRYPFIKVSKVFPERYYVNPTFDEDGTYCGSYEVIKIVSDTSVSLGGKLFDLRDPSSSTAFCDELERLCTLHHKMIFGLSDVCD